MRATSTGLLAACLALAIGGVAQAGFTTVGVYDPASVNDVDQSGVFDSATGAAGAANVVDLATFQALIGTAFANNMGGVVDFAAGGSSRRGARASSPPTGRAGRSR